MNTLENKELLFKDINTRIDEFLQKFPNIVNQITISNDEIFN